MVCIVRGDFTKKCVSKQIEAAVKNAIMPPTAFGPGVAHTTLVGLY